MPLKVENYTDKSIVVRGVTKDDTNIQEELKKLGGKWNANLRGESGWIFSKKREDEVRKYCSEGKAKVSQPKKEEDDDRVSKLERLVRQLTKRVEELESKKVSKVEPEEEVEVEEDIPKRRMLK